MRPTDAHEVPRLAAARPTLSSSQIRSTSKPRARGASRCRRPRRSSGCRAFRAGRAQKRSSPSRGLDRALALGDVALSPALRLEHAPGRSAANRRLNSRSWSRTQWKVAFEKTTSTGSLEARARAGRRRGARPGRRTAPERARACSIIEGGRRRRSPCPPGGARQISLVTRPEPQPASSTVSSPSSSSRASTSGPTPPGGRRRGRRSSRPSRRGHRRRRRHSAVVSVRGAAAASNSSIASASLKRDAMSSRPCRAGA